MHHKRGHTLSLATDGVVVVLVMVDKAVESIEEIGIMSNHLDYKFHA
jgi:hypothetical protein